MNKILDGNNDNTPLSFRSEFDAIYGIINAHKKRAMKAVHNEALNMVWEVGAYVSNRLKHAAWGDNVVRMLSEYIRTQSPQTNGWSHRTIYKMVQFYDTYSTDNFIGIVNHYGMQNYLKENVPFEMAQIKNNEIVPIELAQIKNNGIVQLEIAQIPSVLFSTGWSNHQLIMGKCKTYEQRLFYMLYAGREQLEFKELQRVIKTDAMSAILGGQNVQSKMMKQKYPQSGVLELVIKMLVGNI